MKPQTSTNVILEKLRRKPFNHPSHFCYSGIIQNNLLLLTDARAAPNMSKAEIVLDTFYPKMVHLTCLVHGFYRVAETIRFKLSVVDSLISNIEIIFLEA